MYFDFDDRYRDIEPVGSAINRRDGVAVAIVLHVVFIAALLALPQYLPASQQAELLQQQPQPREEPPMFVFVQPRMELPALRESPRAEISDLDRSARSPLKAPRSIARCRWRAATRASGPKRRPKRRCAARAPRPKPRRRRHRWSNSRRSPISATPKWR